MQQKQNNISHHLFYNPIFFGLLLFFILFSSNIYAKQNSILYKATENGAQISIAIDDKVDYKVETKENILTISFNKPYAKALENIGKELSNFIIEKNISANGNAAILTMNTPIHTKNHIENGQLIIDITRQKTDSIKQNLDKKNTEIKLTFGSHENFNRFVFDFEKKPQYSVKTDDDKTIISFLKEVTIVPHNLKNYSLSNSIEKHTTQLGGVDYIIPEKLLKSSEQKNKLVLDFKKPLPKSPQAKGENTRIITRRPTILQNAQIIPQRSKDDVASLSFPWNTPVGLSLFQRGKHIWVIFDHHQKVNIAQIKKNAAKVIDNVIEIPHNKGTVLRFTPKKNVNVGLRQEGLLWIIDFYTHNVKYNIRELPIFIQQNSLKQPYLFVPTNNAGTVISVIDPEVGDAILAAPNTELGVGIKGAYQYPDLKILPSPQGIALVPDTSDIILARGNTGVSIKAYDRGLNISDDIEELRRQKLLGQEQGDQENLDLKVPPQLMKLDFNAAEEQLKNDIKKAEANNKVKAQMELAKYYIAKGLGTNALKILRPLSVSKSPEASTDKFYALLGVANFLAKRYDEAIDNFSHGKLPNSNEAIFWRTLSSSAQEFKKENNIILFSFISLMKDYPQELKERIAIIGAETAIMANDDISTQNFMDVLKSTEGDENRKANILYLNAQKFELQGYPRNAVREYANIINMNSQKYSSLARFEKTNLDLKLNVISNEKAIPEYERLRYAWGEPQFKLKLLDKLAATYARNKDYYNALQTYKETLTIVDSNNKKQQILDKMVRLFEDVYINNHADNMTPLKSLALYQDFEWLAPRSEQYSEIIQRLADRLVAVDLLNRAADLLKEQLRLIDLTPEQRNKIGTRLALIYLFQEDNLAALEVLEKTKAQDIHPAVAQYRTIIRAKALSNLNRNEEALNLLKDDLSKTSLLMQSEIYWKSGKWDLAANKIKYLIEKPIPGKKLSDEQINYILDWATALKKSGKETVIVRLRNTFQPYFAKTPYYSTFNVLTNNLETDKIDIKAISQVVNDVAAYSNFSKIYNKSLRDTTLGKTTK